MDAISVLYRQFEKFVWPTVPEQEERISQIAELAVRLHGESTTDTSSVFTAAGGLVSPAKQLGC